MVSLHWLKMMKDDEIVTKGSEIVHLTLQAHILMCIYIMIYIHIRNGMWCVIVLTGIYMSYYTRLMKKD